jgi:DNA-directed RNA polymerase I and III subunit RPAC1
MDPQATSIKTRNSILTFTLSNINVSFANALRRIIISEIPTVVIRSSPYEKNDATIHVNTTRLNNEILKQRLSCIPIFIRDKLSEDELREYEVVINKKNESESIEFITTEDFRIKHGDKELSTEVVRQIFPPDPITKDYILFARLRPKISDDIPGEELKITAKLSMGIAKESSTFNVASTCSYAMTPDEAAQYDAWGRKESELEAEKKTKNDIDLQKKNWFLGEGKRIFHENSFDFILESLGVFSNKDLVKMATLIIIEKLAIFQNQIEEGSFPIAKSQGTIPNSFDLTLQNEDYTIGKILECILYEHHYITDGTLSYVGFIKKHPHDDDSLIRMAFKENVDETSPLQYLSLAIKKGQEIFTSIHEQFN